MSILPEVWKVRNTDPWKEERELFWCWRRFKPRSSESEAGDPWTARCDKWMVHATLFAYIKCGFDADKRKWRAARITFLTEHLNILDTKIGILLNFNALVLIAINILFGALYNLIPKPFPAFAHRFGIPVVYVIWTLLVLSLIFGFLWLAITLLCLSGERRLVWGDLGFRGKGQPLFEIKALVSDEQLGVLEDEHVQGLVVAVVSRTNKFRVATRLTFWNVLVLVLTFVVGLLLLYTVNYPAVDVIPHHSFMWIR